MKKIFRRIKLLVFFIVILFLATFGYKFYLSVAYPIKYEEYINQACSIYNVDPALVYAVIKTESKFDETAVSHAGAIGLMQITPSTFEWMNSKNNVKAEGKDLFLPDENIDCGVHLLSFLITKYQNVDTAISAYNAGVGAVDRWLNDPNFSIDGISLKNIPYQETDTYVKRVNQSYKMYRKLYFKNLYKG